MPSIYLGSGQSIANHTHRLERIIDPEYRYRCRDCGANLKTLSGVLLTHEKTACELTNSWYHGSSVRRGGQWKEEYTCSKCGRSCKFLRNYLGQRKIFCDGARFTKELVAQK